MAADSPAGALTGFSATGALASAPAAGEASFLGAFLGDDFSSAMTLFIQLLF
jgi:hypothetical protein